MSKFKVLFQMTGSIACYKACGVISLLAKNNYDVQVVASPSALKFVGEATLEGLSGHQVLLDLWQPGKSMAHIELDRWADLILVAPASANYLNKIALGQADDLLGTLFLAHDFKKPFFIAPAMNQAMYNHPVTQKSLNDLTAMGLYLLPSPAGPLACGELGEGRMMEPQDIFQIIDNYFNKKNRKKILITSGGTQVPIDPIRSIVNTSSGKTGARLAQELILDGNDVTYLHSEDAKLPFLPCEKISFKTYEQLQERLRLLLQEEHFDAVIHAAAVSDFSVNTNTHKLSSDSNHTLTLIQNPKLISQIKSHSKNKNIHIIGFKLTSCSTKEDQELAVDKLFNQSQPDIIIQNDLSQLSNNPLQHSYRIFWSSESSSFVENTNELAKEIKSYLDEVTHDSRS